jgi:hypothetical protein
MRFIRTALALAIACAPAVTAHAEPFDGAERYGTPCAGTVTTQSGSHYGAIAGGATLFANLVANDNGVVHVDPNPGPLNTATVTCMIVNSFGTPEVTITRSAVSGVVVVEPSVVAFTSWYTSGFEACTKAAWTDSTGSFYTYSCLPASA